MALYDTSHLRKFLLSCFVKLAPGVYSNWDRTKVLYESSVVCLGARDRFIRLSYFLNMGQFRKIRSQAGMPSSKINIAKLIFVYPMKIVFFSMLFSTFLWKVKLSQV